ncbi:hypothetical protein [Pseudomonas asiatica]|uniref:Uncharacterized protein n=1 Tax=Pseudomonas asiatica TaxID=2219225 RepID=A0A9X4D045_9PSED|nr:hypothetical protein [Pseudomonas asiatica]MDD2106811.1 hypothetical protein [Pseudomonas asiatica]
MSKDYSKGRYNVFGPDRKQIGRIDEDEFIRSGANLIYRIDGDEIYSMDGKHLGFIDDGIGRTPKGDMLFTIIAE